MVPLLTRFPYLASLHLALAALSAGCSVVDPTGVCLARREGTRYVFSFRTHRGFLLSLRVLTPPTASATNDLEIWQGPDMGHPVWGIERRTGPAISLLNYGTLPEGWVQYYPPQAQPQRAGHDQP